MLKRILIATLFVISNSALADIIKIDILAYGYELGHAEASLQYETGATIGSYGHFVSGWLNYNNQHFSLDPAHSSLFIQFPYDDHASKAFFDAVFIGRSGTAEMNHATEEYDEFNFPFLFGLSDTKIPWIPGNTSGIPVHQEGDGFLVINDTTHWMSTNYSMAPMVVSESNPLWIMAIGLVLLGFFKRNAPTELNVAKNERGRNFA